MMDEWRHLALEIMVTLSEAAPAMVRKNAADYIVALVHEVLKMLTQLEDDDQWSLSDEIVDDDSDRLVSKSYPFDIINQFEIIIVGFLQPQYNC